MLNSQNSKPFILQNLLRGNIKTKQVSMKVLTRMFQLALGILVAPVLCVAQLNGIQGTVTDSVTGHPVQDVTVSLLKENKAIATAFTDQQGTFNLEKVPDGTYQLYITLLGYQPYSSKVMVSKEYHDLGKIMIRNKSVTLNTVEIKQTIPPVNIKKDTIEFNASTIKTRPNAVVEELLKRVPGISVDQNGKITAQGESVKRILVDGKPFFGDNVALTTKNLPAEIIDKIQLIDGKSDQAEFSGFDDGKGEKIINITLKKNRRRGTTGTASLGYGTNDRFAGSANINSFNEHDRLSIIGNGNNLNDRYFNPGNTFAGMLPGSGLTTTWSGAANYNLEDKNKLKIDASYEVANTHTKNQSISTRQTFLPDTSWYYNQQSDNNTHTNDHTVRMRFNYKLDPTQSIMVSPELTYNTTNTLQNNSYQSLNNLKDTSIVGQAFNTTHHNTPELNLHTLYRKRFKKHGRTFSASFSMSTSKDDGNNTFQTINQYRIPVSTTGYNRLTTNNNTNDRLGLRLSYTTPLVKDRLLELSYSWNDQRSHTINKTFDIDSLSGKYEHQNDSLSNTAQNNFQSQTAGFQLRTNKCGYDYTLGMNIQYSGLKNYNSNAPSVHQHYINFFPSGRLNINISKGKTFQASYDGNTVRPTIEQLQPLPNLSNSLLVNEGNPDLKPSFRHHMMIGYNAFNTATFHGLYIHLNTELTTNKIVNINTYDSTGRQYTKPVNANGAFNLNGVITNSLALRQISTDLSLSTGFNYARDITFTNLGDKNFRSFTHALNINERASINYRYKTLLEFNTIFDFTYAGNKYATTTNHNYTYNINFNYNISLPGGFMAGNNLNYIMNRGRSAGYNTTVALLNGFIAKSLFKQKQALVKIYAYDLLHQNVSISRNTGDTYIEDMQQTILKPYWMLSFTWFIKNYPAGKIQDGV